jgi:DNA repair exonuclease SbcCD nuclease subunit
MDLSPFLPVPFFTLDLSPFLFVPFFIFFYDWNSKVGQDMICSVMFRFLHSADWQLGARFARFGSGAQVLRKARITTFRKVLSIAKDQSVDALIVAGDLFEDNQVANSLVEEVLSLFHEFDSTPIFLLPGNHDPFNGPSSIWMRNSFRLPKHVHLFKEPSTFDLPEAVLIASPLTQKVSSTDPSLILKELSETIDDHRIKIGITHGALAIPGKHQPNDFPIALDAASRADLDYLAVGHWHQWLVNIDGGRIVMPGTPEPDRFQSERSGFVALVEIAEPGERPKVQPIKVASLTWHELTYDLHAMELSRASVQRKLGELVQQSHAHVLRILMTGSASPEQIDESRLWLEELTNPFSVTEIVDETHFALSASELEALKERFPIVGQIFMDIVSPNSPTENEATSALPPGMDVNMLTPEHFAKMRQLLLSSLQRFPTV